MAPMRLILCLLLAWPHAASAMRFAYRPALVAGGPGLLSASGKVELGDEERLHDALHALPPGAKLAGLSLDSPGGDLEEGLRLAAAVHDERLQTVVEDGAKCASACFIVFAAGSRRFASTAAMIGVHSVSYGGADNPDAQAMTVRMARRLAGYEVPDAILGKMVTAQPTQIWWLTRSDLDSMRVDPNVPHAAAAAAIEPEAVAAGKPVLPPIKHGFRVEPAAHGYQVTPPPMGGFEVWRPG